MSVCATMSRPMRSCRKRLITTFDSPAPGTLSTALVTRFDTGTKPLPMMAPIELPK